MASHHHVRKIEKKRKNSSVSEKYNKTILELPRDVLEDILSRLPPDKIVQLYDNFLNKELRSTILSHRFAQVFRNKNKSLASLFVYNPIGKIPSFLIQYNVKLRKYHIAPFDVKGIFSMGLENTRTSRKVLHSFDGWLLIRVRNTSIYGEETNSNVTIRLVHPIFRQYVLPPDESDTYELGVAYKYSFGFSPDLRKYKVLRVKQNKTLVDVHVLTVGDVSWRRINFGQYDEIKSLWLERDPVVLNNKLHWIASVRGEKYIVGFNIAKETFDFSSLPCKGNKQTLVVLNGFLYLVSYDNFARMANGEIWVMREDETWRLLIAYETDRWLCSFEVVQICEDETILLMPGVIPWLAHYDPRTKHIDHLKSLNQEIEEMMTSTYGMFAIQFAPCFLLLAFRWCLKNVYLLK